MGISGSVPGPRIPCQAPPPRYARTVIGWHGPPLPRASVRIGTALSKKSAPAPSYREAAAEIESILARLDDESDVDIDEIAARVERAAELIRFCTEKLRSAELRIEKVTRDLAGTASGTVSATASGDETGTHDDTAHDDPEER